MTQNNTLQTVEKSPVEIVTREQVEATLAKIRVMVPDAAKMNESQLKHIAQESILFRTIPGKDIHYFVNPSTGKLERVEDYKYLISFTENRERVATGDRNLKIKYQSHTLTPEEKLAEGAGQDDFGVRVTVTTTRDADAFRHEVKAWMDFGLKVEDAMKAAKETTGEAGSSSVGIVKRSDGNIPKGWSPLQKAEKLAIKNAIHKRWGSPTVDELAAYVRGLAKLALPEDWEDVPLELPAEAQARWADMNAQGRDIAERSAGLTIEQHAERLKEQTSILRGNDEGEIGGDWREIISEPEFAVTENEAESPPVESVDDDPKPKKPPKPFKFGSTAAEDFFKHMDAITDGYFENNGFKFMAVLDKLSLSMGEILSNPQKRTEAESALTDHARQRRAEKEVTP